jgi:hypothetical protein
MYPAAKVWAGYRYNVRVEQRYSAAFLAVVHIPDGRRLEVWAGQHSRETGQSLVCRHSEVYPPIASSRDVGTARLPLPPPRFLRLRIAQSQQGPNTASCLCIWREAD